MCNERNPISKLLIAVFVCVLSMLIASYITKFKLWILVRR